MSKFQFELSPLRYDQDEIVTESFLTDFIKNVFSFGKIDKNTKYEELTKFRDMLVEPQNLFGKAPETAQYLFTLKPVIVDKKKNIISIQRINYDLLFKHIKETYDEKRLNTIFYKTYNGSDITRFNKKRMKRGEMRITSLISPMFFALELSILFSQLYKKYRLKVYGYIATTIYNESWLSEADNRIPGKVDINYAKSLLNEKYELKPHQIEFIEAYPIWKSRLNLRGVYNAFDQGLGKTLTSLSLAMALHIDKIYVVCPNTLVPVWYNEIIDYYDGKIKPFDCKNSKPDRDTRVFIVNNESIKSIYPYIDSSCKSMLIIDEGHNFRTLNSVRVKDLIELRKRLQPSDVLPMSGTPLKASPNELVPALLLLDPLFTPEAAEIYNKCFNFDNYQAMEIVTARLGKVIYRKMKSDVLQLPNKTIEDYRVTIRDPEPFLMSNVKKAVMEEYESIFPSVIDKNIIILDNFKEIVNKYSTAGQLATRWYISKICQAADYNTDYTIEQLHELDSERVTTFLSTYVFSNPSFPSRMQKQLLDWESKLIHFDKVAMGKAIGKIYPPRRTALFNAMWDENESVFLDMINHNIKKTVIFSQFFGVITHIKERLEMNGIKTVTVNGKVNNNDRSKNLREFKHNEDVRVIIATSQSMGTGVTLTEASQMFFFGPPWRSTDFDQCCDRIYRIGQDTDVRIYNVILNTPQLNLSSKMDKILKWSSDMFHSAIDSTIVSGESANESYHSLDYDKYLIGNEGYIFNQTPIFLNYDNWLKGESKILYITGLSGSGKGYHAKQIADNVDNCIIFELDKFENYMWYLDKKHKEHPAVAKGDKIIFGYLNKKYDLSTNIFDNSVEKYNIMMKEFYEYLLGYVKSHPENQYIMEGIQIYCDKAFETISNKDSVIILRTSMVKSMHRVMSRDHCEIRNHLHTFIDFQKRLREFERRLNISKVKVANEALNQSNRKLIVKIIESENPNDPVSTKAVDLEFYDNNNKIGMASVSAIDTNNAFLYNLEVFKKYRGQGYANDIMKYVLSNYQITELTVTPDNDIAINLYKKFGFKFYKKFKENGKKMFNMRKRFNANEVKIATESSSNHNKFSSPEDLLKWMQDNVSYANFTKLKNPMEVLMYKKGSCHDQVVFELFYLRQLGIDANALFLIESNSIGQGGMTHSFVYYKKDGKYYWFENAWEIKSGIHEYSSLKEITDDFRKMHKEGVFGNYKKYPKLQFMTFIYQINDNLQMLVNRMFRPI